jgi:CRISPR/Cas system-associated endoribonuclease Cas2
MVAVAKAFLKKYLNRVDRSVFFVFYEDLDFRHIEQNTINILASQHSHLLRPAYLAYRDIL